LDENRRIDDLEDEETQQIARIIVSHLMESGGYTSEQTAINEVVNTAEFAMVPDEDGTLNLDKIKWQRWIDVANRIVTPFVEEKRGSKFAEQGDEMERQMDLQSQKIDHAPLVARKFDEGEWDQNTQQRLNFTREHFDFVPDSGS